MPDVFLSYSRDDQSVARRFAEALEHEGLRVWWDQALNPGETFDQVTVQALREARAVVVLWSRRSVESRWVRSEATQADRHGTLMPVMIEPCERPILFELTHTADLSGWDGNTAEPRWRSFIDSLRRFIDREAARPEPPRVIPSGASTRAYPAAAAPAVPGTPHRPLPGLALLVAVLAALLLGAGLAWLLTHRARSVAPEQGAAASPAPAGSVSLAVLPFANLSPDPSQEYFSDGLTEEILNQLAQVRELIVTGRTSSFSFKGRNEDLRVIAEKLGVANLLEGSVRREGNQLRITAQLIDGRTGAQRWSQTYARELQDVFAVQEEIAKDVARALSITLDVGDTSRAQGGTTNVDAYDLYLRARSLSARGGRVDVEQAISLFRQAVALDPGFSRAWLALATALDSPAGLVVYLKPDEAAAVIREANEARQRARQAAPGSWTAQVVRLEEVFGKRDWAEAYATARMLADAAPTSSENLFDTDSGLGALMAVGHLNEAVHYGRRRQQAEPLSQGVSTGLQIFLYANRQYDEAEAEYQRSLGLEGNHQRGHFRGLLLRLARGAGQREVEAQFKAVLGEENVPAPFLRQVAEVIGDRSAALTVLQRALEDPGNGDFARLLMIHQLADALDDGELALAALRRVVRENGSRGNPLIWLAPNSNMRTLPGFKDLLREMGLAQYFRESGDWGDVCRPVGSDDFECR